jgi:lysophospholipase L1-like esterase
MPFSHRRLRCLSCPPSRNLTITFGVSTNYIATGNATSSQDLDGATKISSWYLLKGVEVDAGSNAASIVALGASITDGAHTTPDKNARWPDVLAARLQSNKSTSNIGLLNEGISGGRVLHDITGPSALSRLDRDVLAQPGAKYLIIAIGTNDIGRTYFPLRPGVTIDKCLGIPADLRHIRGIKSSPHTQLSAQRRAQEITPRSTPSRADKADVHHSIERALLMKRSATYDSGDHLHPNDWHKAMGEAIDLISYPISLSPQPFPGASPYRRHPLQRQFTISMSSNPSPSSGDRQSLAAESRQLGSGLLFV